MMRRLIFILPVLLWLSGIVLAQETLSEEYIFVDGTVVNFPPNFLIIYEDYDEMRLAGEGLELRFYITYERTILSLELNSLPEILDWWWDDPDVYEIGDEEPVVVGERGGIQFMYKREDSLDARMILLPAGDNGSVVVVTIIPEDNDTDTNDALIFSIIESLHVEDFVTGLDHVLDNSLIFDDGWMMEYRNDWQLNTDDNSLTRDDVMLRALVYSSTEIETLALKDDPIELLYYDFFAPVDESIVFDPENISFVDIRGLEGIRYAVLDTVNEDNLQRVYFLATLNEDAVLAMDISAPVGANILQNEDVQDMIQTIRPDGTLPPIEMISFDNTFILEGAGEVRFPAYWRARENDNDTVTLSTLDVNLYLVPFNATDSVERGFPSDLPGALLSIVSPLDESVVLNPDDVSTGTLENGNAYAEITYIETDDGYSYPRTVMVILLDDNSMVFAAYIPQPGVAELSDSNQNEVRVILNTIVP